ncbi:MAG: hypothetical protein L0Y57_01195 [Beijerinckiaceae bacterium]|nr:hypothetical protein [Beijerinckiaceae bacterium]
MASFLGHDPRSRFWPQLPQYLKTIYEQKQRATDPKRIKALEEYVSDKILNPEKFGAIPPLSVVQFEPFSTDQVTRIENNLVKIEDSEAETTRVLIDGLARFTTVVDLRERLKIEQPEKIADLDQLQLSIALYVPREKAIGADCAGQLFTDFNLYAWPVTGNQALAGDLFNPYKRLSNMVNAEGSTVRRYGGLKIGSSNLGRKDVAFATQMVMAQFCKVAVEGRVGMGKLSRPLPNPRCPRINIEEEGKRIADFFTALENHMGANTFRDRTKLFRQAHGLYALAVVLNDVLEHGRATIDSIAHDLAHIEWSWANEDFQKKIGRFNEAKQKWTINTGSSTTSYLIEYCRQACGIPVITQAKRAA